MKVTIVGCGVGGVTAAMSMRERDHNAEISVFTDENYLYYPRPRLYEVIAGEREPHQICPYPSDLYAQEKIKVTLGKKVQELRTNEKTLVLEDKSSVAYDRLLLANGSQPFRPPIDGIDRKGVFTLRTIEDALAIREYAKKTREAIVIGGGLLGLEFAACLKKSGQEVKVIEINAQLLPRQLDEEGSKFLEDHLGKLGIGFVLDAKTKEILGQERASGVALGNGKELSAGLILIAAGIKSNVQLAQNAGINVDKGVIVNEHMRTSANDVYAAGDVAEFKGRVYGIIPPSIEQAKIASESILHDGEQIYKGTIPFTTLKIAGIALTSIGVVNPDHPGYEEIRKTDSAVGSYKELILDKGRIVGAIVIGERKGIAGLKRLIDLEVDVSKYEDSMMEDGFDFGKIPLS